jgi:hypothetical protein
MKPIWEIERRRKNTLGNKLFHKHFMEWHKYTVYTSYESMNTELDKLINKNDGYEYRQRI